MRVRKATFHDVEAIAELGKRLIASSDFAHTTPSTRAMMQRFMLAIHNVREWLGVAEHEGKIVGALLLTAQRYYWTEGEYCIMDDGIYAERAGAGAALVRSGLKWAATVPGVRDVLIAINSGMDVERTVRLLEHCGLRRRGVCVSLRVDGAEAKRWAA